MFKHKVLQILEENRGSEISGVFIAERLGVSRAAVCKAVAELRSDGNAVESRRNGGYKLLKDSSAISDIGIKGLLKNQLPVYCYDRVDSTNTRAKMIAFEGKEATALVVADEQTEGRGRRGRSFFSPSGSGAYFSLLIKPELTYAECQRVVPMTAVAVSRAIEKTCGIKTEIKWVNDLYFKGRKVCGIATESIGDVSEPGPSALIVGIGINVDTHLFPSEIENKAGSLGVAINRNALIAACVNEFFELFGHICSNSFMNEYRKKCFVIGQKVKVLTEPPYEAIAEDVDNDGRLIVKNGDGKRVKLTTDEVSVLPIDLKGE